MKKEKRRQTETKERASGMICKSKPPTYLSIRSIPLARSREEKKPRCGGKPDAIRFVFYPRDRPTILSSRVMERWERPPFRKLFLCHRASLSLSLIERVSRGSFIAALDDNRVISASARTVRASAFARKRSNEGRRDRRRKDERA